MIHESHEFHSPEQIVGQLQEQLKPLEKDVRDFLQQTEREQFHEIECITWTKTAEELLEDSEIVFPKGTRIFHCTNQSISDPHHWIEMEVPWNEESITIIWDDTRQKMKGHSIVLKNSTHAWTGFSDPHVEKIQIN